MSYSAAGQADRPPRRPPQVGPRDAPHHGELAAVVALVLLLAHLLLAQLALLLTAAMYAINRLTRWRPEWLAVPAGIGLVWALAVGPSRAVRGLEAGPRQVLDYLGGIGGHPGHLLHLSGAYAGLGHWLPEQFPLALILASAETLGLCWLRRRLGGGHPWRAGLIVAARRQTTVASLRSGAGVVSRDGCCVGVDVATGRPATISWREAEGGVLCAGTAVTESGFALAHAAVRRRKPVIVIDLTGSAWLAESLAAACTEPGAPFSCFGPAGPACYEPLRGGDPARAAALVMATIDWADVGDQQRRSCAAYLTDALAVQAAAPGDRRVPVLDDLIRLLTPEGLRERAAQIPAYHPRRGVLTDRAAVSAGLLQADPATVAAPAVQLPRLRASALGRWLGAGPAGTPRVSLGQTIRERGVTLFSLDSGPRDNAAGMVAGLAVADLMAVCGELTGMSVPGDSLAWINGCEVLGQQVMADLVRLGHDAGMAVVLGMGRAGPRRAGAGSPGPGPVGVGSVGAGSVGGAGTGGAGSGGAGSVGAGTGGAGSVGAGTGGAGSGGAGTGGAGSGGAADRLAAEVNVLVAGGPVDPALVGAFVGGNRAGGPGWGGIRAGGIGAGGAGWDGIGVGGVGWDGIRAGGPGWNGAPALGRGTDGWPGPITDGWPGTGVAVAGGFALLAREPRARMLPQCRHVPARQRSTVLTGSPAGPRPQPPARP